MKTRTTMFYAGLAALIGMLVQVLQVATAIAANQSSPVDSPTRWAISTGAGIIAAGVVAALPWLKADLPQPPQA